MGVYRFEDLRVWQAARKQCDEVEQINSASISVMNNISEGFLRHRDKEFLQFLRVAAGSNGEVRSCLYSAQDRRHISQEEAARLIEASNVIGRMIRRLQDTLEK